MDRSDHLVVAGKRLEVVRHGPAPGEAPTLVFLHEGLGCAAMWREFPRRLAEATGCGSLVYSRLGYGASDPCELPRPMRYMHDEALAVLPELLEVARVGPYVLVGHSDGASIALIHAGAAPPGRLRCVVSEAAHVFREDLTERSIRQAGDAYATGGLRERLAKYHGDNTDCAFRGWHDAWLADRFALWDLREHLPDISVPVLVMQGRQDPYGTAAQVEALRDGLGDRAEILWLDDCAHCPHRDRENATLDAMSTFINAALTAAAVEGEAH